MEVSLMSTHLTEPNVGSGPYNVEHDEADSFYYLTLHGTRTGKSYPLGKTAYRTARKLNDEHTGSAEAEPPVFLDDAPEAPQPPKAKPSKPKAPKEPKAAPVPPTGSKTFTFKADAVYEGTREEWERFREGGSPDLRGARLHHPGKGPRLRGLHEGRAQGNRAMLERQGEIGRAHV